MTNEIDTRNLPSVPDDGKCSHCGGDSFMLAKDSTTYSPNIRISQGKVDMADSYDDTQPSDVEDAVRFFCDSCDERCAVPKELQA